MWLERLMVMKTRKLLLSKYNSIGTDRQIVRDELFLNKDGTINWGLAPNNGRVPGSEIFDFSVKEGTFIDRYGPANGKYVSPYGVPYEQRALPYVQNNNAYHVYYVNEDIYVTSSEISPAFNYPGGGIQYELPGTVDKMVEQGILTEVK